jgi:hypothetical protein
MPAVVGISKIWRQFVQPEIPFGFVSAMAIDAVARQQRPELIREYLGVGRLIIDCRRRCDACHDKQRQTSASQQFDRRAPRGHSLSPSH